MRSSLVFGLSAAISGLLGDCELYARESEPVLILGERGTGKTELASHLHILSGRRGPFAPLSTREVPDGVAHSMLGGHRRGAFTGAVESSDGMIEGANHGTLFIDELADASAQLQAMLLYLLDRQSVRRLGEGKGRSVDVRVIAATNADLERLITLGSFRRDLLDRLDCLVLHVPPLRERKADILPLAQHFLAEFNSRETAITSDAEEKLLDYPWPANVRELSKACRYAAIHSRRAPSIGVEHLSLKIRNHRAVRSEPKDSQRLLALNTVAVCGGNKSEAARRLNVSRPTLYALMRGLDDARESPLV